MSLQSATPVMRWLLAAAMLATAAWMWGHLPTKMQSWAPITVNGSVGDRIEGRNLAVTVHDVQVAREVTLANDGAPVRMPTTGVWLVIEISYAPLLTAESVAFVLEADGKSFESPLDGFTMRAPPGLDDHSVVAFELPEIPAGADLMIYNKTPDRWGNPMRAPLDSQIAVALPLPARMVDSVDLNKVAQR